MASLFKSRRPPPTVQSTPRPPRTSGWRCTFCLKRLSISDLEWRCPRDESCSWYDPSRPPTTHRLIIGDGQDALRPDALLHQEEQSYPCPSKGCASVHSDIYVTGCDAPQRTELALPPERVHHVSFIPIDHDTEALKTVFAGHILAPRLLDSLIGRSDPDFQTRSLINQSLQYGSKGPAREGLGPYGTRLLDHSRQLYFHWMPLKDGDQTRVMLSGRSGCTSERPDWIERCILMDSVVLSYRVNNAQGPRRAQMRQRAQDLTKNIDDFIRFKPEQRLPELRVVLTSERELGRLLGQPVELPSQPELREQVMEGYVLDTLGLRSLLGPLLGLPWSGISCGLVDSPFILPEAVRGLSDWFASLAEIR